MKKQIKAIAIFVGLAGVFTGMSYCSEQPKYAFEKRVVAFEQKTPGLRLIHTVKTGDLTSPVTWFRANTTAYHFGKPDLQNTNRFEIISVVYGQPVAVYEKIVDVSCNDHTMEIYSTTEEQGSVLVNWLGQEVANFHGKPYRFVEPQPTMDPSFIKEFCNTSWENEIREMRS